MTPEVNILDTEYANTNKTSDTYKMDMEALVIKGLLNNKDAIAQAVYKILMTEKDTYIIYDKDYGIKLNDLFGKDTTYIISILKLRIEDALKNDDRIKSIKNFSATANKHSISVEFTVESVFGDIDIEKVIESWYKTITNWRWIHCLKIWLMKIF